MDNRENNSLCGSIGKKFLVIIGDRVLRPKKYKKFDVSYILFFIYKYSIELIQNETAGYSEDKKNYHRLNDLPIYRNEANLLISECVANYLENGEYYIYDYKIKSNRRITGFKITTHDLDILLTGLQDIIEETEHENINGRRERILSLYEILRREREKHE